MCILLGDSSEIQTNWGQWRESPNYSIVQWTFLHQYVTHFNFQIHKIFRKINAPETHKSLVSPNSELCVSLLWPNLILRLWVWIITLAANLPFHSLKKTFISAYYVPIIEINKNTEQIKMCNICCQETHRQLRPQPL